jgi:hypothetical protein
MQINNIAVEIKVDGWRDRAVKLYAYLWEDAENGNRYPMQHSFSVIESGKKH